MSIQTINPATGKTISTWPLMSEDEVNQIISQSHEVFLYWSQANFDERSKCFFNIAEILLSEKDKYAELITMEMGKPIKSAGEEVEKCAWVCRHFAENSAEYLAKRVVKTELLKSYVVPVPLGIIFAIMPWNYPFWQVFRFAAPSMMAGNTALLKHAPITTGCALEIEKIFKRAGFPEHVFQVMRLDNADAENVIRDSRIAAVTLTGSYQTGKKVAAITGNALKKIVLELGGNDPYIVLEDADLDQAADAVLASRMNNTGQSCIAAKRLLAVQSVREQFQQILLKKLQQYKVGNPLDPDNSLGPLAREDLRANLHRQIVESEKHGAIILQGGKITEGAGFYYPITVLVDVKKGMPAYEEELFGPVFTFINVKDEIEAIKIANESQFGLSAAIFSKNIERAENIAVNKLEAGTVFINDLVRSDPRLPFGGIKCSGFGRELSREGILEFVNIKTIGIR